MILSECGLSRNIYNPRHRTIFKVLLNQKCSSMSSSGTPSVLVTRSDLPEKAIKKLSEKCAVEIWTGPDFMPHSELLKQIRGKNGLLCFLTDKIDVEVLDAAGPSLKVIGTYSVGFDHIDIKECKKRNISVGNTPGILTDCTADLTVSLLLATSRRLFEASEQVTNGGWHKASFSPLWMCGMSLKGKTVGIVGMGRIGFAVAERLKPFKVAQFVYYGNSPKKEAEEVLNAKFVSFEELLHDSDFVIVCCSLNPKTKGLFNEDTFKKMKSTAILINTSRGAVIDQDALYNALVNKQIYAAGLDVMTPEPLPIDHPLIKLNNCVLLPHIGSATVQTRNEMADLTVRNILAGLQGEPLITPL